MRILYFLLVCLLASTSCKKENHTPPANPVTEMDNIPVTKPIADFYNDATIDVNQDGRADIVINAEQFNYDNYVATEYRVRSKYGVLLAADTEDASVDHLVKGATISSTDPLPRKWAYAVSSLLIQKSETANTSRWEGPWINVRHGYLAFQIYINNQLHLGWVELSADPQNEQLIIHRAALSKLPAQKITAGL